MSKTLTRLSSSLLFVNNGRFSFSSKRTKACTSREKLSKNSLPRLVDGLPEDWFCIAVDEEELWPCVACSHFSSIRARSENNGCLWNMDFFQLQLFMNIILLCVFKIRVYIASGKKKHTHSSNNLHVKDHILFW